MAIKPILFNVEMVKAILEGRKTQTRRLIKDFAGENITSILKPDGSLGKYSTKGWCGMLPDRGDGNEYCIEVRPPCEPGDILWVRETWDNVPVSPGGHFRFVGRYYYKADGDLRPDSWRGNWHPSIHMPKEAARIFLRVMKIGVQRLQDILVWSGEVKKEGIPYDDEGDIEASGLRFKELWNSTIKPADRDRYSWEANPWVWVIEFERCEKPEGWQ